jgi:hypothetical protein
MKRFWICVFGFSLLAAVVFISYVDYGSVHYDCSADRIAVCHIVCDPDYRLADPKKTAALEALIERKARGDEPTREELMNAAVVVPYADITGLNGVYCNDNIFVRDNLGDEGKAFVARHEFAHALGDSNVRETCSYGESCATMNAALAYPMGFVETVASSLWFSFEAHKDKQCFFFDSWGIFKVYILPALGG